MRALLSPAVLLWATQSVLAALWVVEHVQLGRWSRKGGRSWVESLVFPLPGAWGAGNAWGVRRWLFLAGAYGLSQWASAALR